MDMSITAHVWMSTLSGRKIAHQTELTKVILGNMPLKLPVEIHWKNDNPLEHATGGVNIHWKMPLKIHWTISLKIHNDF